MAERKITCPKCGKEVCIAETKEGDFVRPHKDPKTQGEGDREWCENSGFPLIDVVEVHRNYELTNPIAQKVDARHMTFSPGISGIAWKYRD